MNDVISAELVDLGLSAGTREAAARALAARMAALGRVTDLDGFLADVAAREEYAPTGLDGGIGIPHCRSAHVTEPTLAFGRCAAGIDFGAADGPADLVFLIAAPAGADDAHLTILSSLARKLTNPQFTAALRATHDAAAAAALIRGDMDPEAAPVAASEVAPVAASMVASADGAVTDAAGAEGLAGRADGAESAESAETAEAARGAGRTRAFRIVAVTSCPTASPTPTWRPSPWRRRAAGPGSRSSWRLRGRPVSPGSTRP